MLIAPPLAAAGSCIFQKFTSANWLLAAVPDRAFIPRRIDVKPCSLRVSRRASVVSCWLQIAQHLGARSLGRNTQPWRSTPSSTRRSTTTTSTSTGEAPRGVGAPFAPWEHALRCASYIQSDRGAGRRTGAPAGTQAAVFHAADAAASTCPPMFAAPRGPQARGAAPGDCQPPPEEQAAGGGGWMAQAGVI